MGRGVPVSSAGDGRSATLLCAGALVKALDAACPPPQTDAEVTRWVEAWREEEYRLNRGARSWGWCCAMITPDEIRTIVRLKPYRDDAEVNTLVTRARGWRARMLEKQEEGRKSRQLAGVERR